VCDPANAPLVSVILPTHNRAGTLARAIASVRAQTYPAWELIVVDDASSDETADVVRRCGDARIAYLRLPIGCGHPARPRNIGWTLARGVYVAYLDDDNAWRPQHLARLVAAAEARPGAVGAYGGRCVHRLDGATEEMLDPTGGVDTGDVLHRRDVVNLLPEMWRESNFAHEDSDFWARLRRSYPDGLVWVPAVLSDYYVHPGNRFFSHWQSFRRYDAAFYARHAARLGDPRRWRALADLVGAFAPRRVLDVGCGRGGVVRTLRERGVAAWGTDPSPATGISLIPRWLVRTAADRLPFPAGTFDVVLCADVLARIPERYVAPSLREMASVCAGALVLAINCNDPGAEGTLTLRPRAWWRDQLAAVGILAESAPDPVCGLQVLVGRPRN